MTEHEEGQAALHNATIEIVDLITYSLNHGEMDMITGTKQDTYYPTRASSFHVVIDGQVIEFTGKLLGPVEDH